MQFSLLLASAVLAYAAPAPAELPTALSNFTQVPLTAPMSWTAGKSLFPGNVIAGENAEYNDYTAETWSQHVLEVCATYSACTSTLSFSGINTGTPAERFWFGYVFRGGRTDESFYKRSAGVEDSVAYTIAQ